MAELSAQAGAVAAPDARGFDAQAYVHRESDGSRSLHLVVDNLHCPSCVNQIESTLKARPGVMDARVNLTTRRLRLRWQPSKVNADDLLDAVIAQGFRLTPYDPGLMTEAWRAEDRMLLRCLAVSGFAAANVMLLSVAVWSGLAQDMGPATRSFMHWLSALIALPTVAYAGRPFFRSALGALRNGHTNMDVPISLAVILAAGVSLWETVSGGEQVYFDASVTLLFFLLIGRFLDRRVRGRARSAAENLMLLRAVAATVVEADGTRRALPVGAVLPGMTVAVAAGERVPVDGVVIEGRSDIDTSLVTGETVPQSVAPGASVHAGTLNLGAPLQVRVAAADEDTLLAEIVRLMEGAEQGRARYVRLADRVARYYAPVVHLLAAGTFLGWLLLGGIDWQPVLLIAVAVLIVTCPCALGLAVPAVQVAAVGRLLGRGVLVKAPDGLERLAQVDTVVFDKTGTLTLGRPELANATDVSRAALIWAAALAGASRHPLAQAVLRAAGPVPVAGDVLEEPGMGLIGTVDGMEMRLGNREWCGVEMADSDRPESELWLAAPSAKPIRFAFRDQVRSDTANVVAALRSRGLALELLSGDHRAAVQDVATAIGIDAWQAGCRPADKIARLEALAAQGRRVLMVGDGLNDAPALAAAFASISPATAADVSQTAADFVFQGEALEPMVQALDTARVSRRLVLQNFLLSFAYNALAVPIAVAGFVTPLIAAIAMSGSSLIVTLNSLRAKLEPKL